MARTGLVYHPDYLEHDMGHTHPESPERLRAIVGRLEETGLLPSLIRIDPKPATDDWITQVHENTYVKGLRQRAPQSGHVSLDPDTSMSPGSLGAAYLAGLTVNLWKSREEIAAQWQVEKRFEPRMEAGKREELMARWREAVRRSLRWSQATPRTPSGSGAKAAGSVVGRPSS